MHTIEEFKRERNEALLSLDETRIRAMVKKFNGTEMPTDSRVFWGAVHKAITGATDLPIEFRRASKAYLDAHGLRSFDDGDLEGGGQGEKSPDSEPRHSPSIVLGDCSKISDSETPGA